MRKGYTTAIRMGAGFNDMTVYAPGSAPHRVDLPPPIEPYQGRKPEKTHATTARLSRMKKREGLLGKLGRDLCAAYGIEGKRKRAAKEFRVVIEGGRQHSEVRLAA